MHFLLGKQTEVSWLTKGPRIVKWVNNARVLAQKLNLGASDLKCMVAALHKQAIRDNQLSKFPCCMTVEVQENLEELDSEGIRKETNDALEETKRLAADAGIAFEFQKKKDPSLNDLQDSDFQASHPLVVDKAVEMWSLPRSTQQNWRGKVDTYASGHLKCPQEGECK